MLYNLYCILLRVNIVIKRSFCLILSLLIAISVVFSVGCGEKSFTVRFHANGGVLVSGEEVQTVTDASQLVPPVYEREGYVLSFDKVLKNITKDTEVFAVWSPINYKLTFDGDEGVFHQITISISLGKKLPELPVPEKAGYIFVGWYIGETHITSGFTWTFTEDKKAVARYVLDDGYTYSITYDLDGGELIEPKTYYTAEEPNFTLKEPIKKGYDFIGWKENGEGEAVKNKVIESGTTGNLSFTATYAPKTYEVSFNSNVVGTTYENISVIYDSELGELPTPTKDGHLFLGWYYGETPVVSGQKWTYAENIALVAKWQEKDGQTFSITYDLKGGAIDNPKTIYKSYEDDFYLQTPIKDGYVFKGYVKEGETEVVNPVTIKKGTTGNLKFTAVWEKLYVFKFELKRSVRCIIGGNVVYKTAYCTVNGKDYLPDISLTLGEKIILPMPSIVNTEDFTFTRNKFWIIDVPTEELNGRAPDDVGLVIYSGDVVTEEIIKHEKDGVITVRPRIRPTDFS